MTKLELNDEYWNKYGKNIPVLIEDFSHNPNADSDEFDKLMDCIWDSGVCMPAFYAVIPHLIDITVKQEFDIAKDLWIYISSWVSVQDKYRSGVSENILKYFDLSLDYAEKVCAKFISEQGKLLEEDAIYLYSGLFAFARHPFGFMTLSAYKDDIAGTSIAKCDNEHLNDVTVYNSGLMPYEEEEEPHEIITVNLEYFEYPFEEIEQNNWKCLEHKIQNALLKEDVPNNIRTHLKLSKLIIEKGISSKLPMKFAFSLCGSLLYCEDSVDLSNRIFHGWDILTCQTCGERFQFSEHWCENS